MNSLYEQNVGSNSIKQNFNNEEPMSFITANTQFSEVTAAKKNLDTVISDFTEVLPLKTDGVSNDRRYKCLKCLKLFKRHEHLKRHIITHTGEKLFKCTYHMCSKKFSRSDEVKRHYKTHLNSYINHDGSTFNKKKIIKKGPKNDIMKNNAILEKKLLTMENTNDSKVSLPPIYQTPISSSNNFLNNLINNNDSSVSDFYMKQSQNLNYNLTTDGANPNVLLVPQSMSTVNMAGLNMFQLPALTPGTLNASPLVTMSNNMQQPLVQPNVPLFSNTSSGQNSNSNTNGTTTPILKAQQSNQNNLAPNNKNNAWITNLRPVSSVMSFTNNINNQSSLNLNALNLMPVSQSKSNLPNMSVTSLMALNNKSTIEKNSMMGNSYQNINLLRNSNSATNLLSLPLSNPPNNLNNNTNISFNPSANNNANSGISKMGSLNQLNLLGSFNSSMNLLAAHNNVVMKQNAVSQIEKISEDDDDDEGFELVIKGRSAPIVNSQDAKTDDNKNTENKISVSNSASPGSTGKKLPSLKDIFH